MRCPKCGFNSFDHNLLCPKCRKDLTAARKLLNLSVPSPGAVDFFKTAASRTVFPEPFLADEVEVFPEAAEIEAAESIEPLPAGAETEEIEPIDEVEEIKPNDDEIEPDDEEIEPEDDEIEPDDEEIEPDDEAIEPADAGVAFAGQSAQQAVLPVGDEEIEIELDEFEELEPEAPAGDPGAELTVAPSIAETALAQIKSSLTATGDLTADVEIEPEPALVEEAAEALEAEPAEFAAETPVAESRGIGPEELESPDLLEESGIIDVTAIAEALPDESAIALDDDFLSDAIGKLPDLTDDFDLEN